MTDTPRRGFWISRGAVGGGIALVALLAIVIAGLAIRYSAVSAESQAVAACEGGIIGTLVVDEIGSGDQLPELLLENGFTDLDDNGDVTHYAWIDGTVTADDGSKRVRCVVGLSDSGSVDHVAYIDLPAE